MRARSLAKNCWSGGCSFSPRTSPVASSRLASRTASGPRVGSTLTNGIATSGFSAANASTSSLVTCVRPDSRSSTVKTTNAMRRER